MFYIRLNGELDTGTGTPTFLSALVRHFYPNASLGAGLHYEKNEKLSCTLRGKKAYPVASNKFVNFVLKGRCDIDQELNQPKPQGALELVWNILDFQKEQDVRLKVGYELVDKMLQKATDDFSDENVLGKGGFGVVYKGELDDGTKIAVKRRKSGVNATKWMNEFLAEMKVLTKVRHRHLVAFIGYCIDGNESLLVYEYMSQGTLSQHLFKWKEQKKTPLSWKQRVSIALDVGRGVEYLHSLAQQNFIHRDLKPANILLGDDMRAKVADFGLVKITPNGKYSVETRVAGTFGYLAPEYSATGRVTAKADVYSFGVVLMQLITGRKALDGTMPDESCQLATWFRRVPITKENMVKYADKALDTNDNETLESIFKVAELEKHCTAAEPFHRPHMGYIVNVLGRLFEQWKPLQQEQENTYHRRHMSLPQALQADDDTSCTLDIFQPNSF